MAIFGKILEYFNSMWYDLYRKKGTSESGSMDIERDIIINSYYVISYFNEKGVSVTNLKLQKLMYFMEGLYMSITDEDFLYNDEFYAWTFGPVCKKLYDYYKKFESNEISLNEEEKKLVKEIPEFNKIFIQSLFKFFGKWSAYDLVELTHEEGSPWSMVYVSEEETDDNIIVPKLETKKWLRKKLGLV